MDSPHLLALVTSYGYLGFAVLVAVAAAGVPLPLSVLLFAVGALSAAPHGPNLVVLSVIGTLAALCGDSLDYGLGRMGSSLARDRILQVLERLHGSKSSRVLERLWRHQGPAVFLTRCLITALSMPVSILAGASRMPYLRFVAWGVAGKALFVVVCLASGRCFGGSLIGNGPLTTLLWTAVVLGVAALALWELRRWRAGVRPTAEPIPPSAVDRSLGTGPATLVHEPREDARPG